MSYNPTDEKKPVSQYSNQTQPTPQIKIPNFTSEPMDVLRKKAALRKLVQVNMKDLQS